MKKKNVLLAVALGCLIASSSFASLDCSSVLKSLNLGKTDRSLGYAGAVDVEDAKTGEIVRLFLVQTGSFKNKNQIIMDFVASGVMPIKQAGKLFQELNQRTNFQLMQFFGLPGFSNDCRIGFAGRQFGPDATLITKEVKVLGSQTLTLKSDQHGSHELENEIVIRYHGKSMD